MPGTAVSRAWNTGLHALGQWAGAHGVGSAGLVGKGWRRHALHRTGKSVGEWLRRVVQRAIS